MFKNKAELIQFVKNQTNIELSNDKKDILNNKRNYLHTKIDNKCKIAVLSLLNKYNIHYESHLSDYYLVFIK